MNYKHGMAETSTWRSWSMMRRRCAGYTPVHKARYTDRGITFSERWLSFENFLADMGKRPEGTTLDRIDPNGPYSPENCRWATHHEQMRNTSRSVKLTLNGRTMVLTQWARELGLNRQTLQKRIKSGWPIDQVLSSHQYHERKGRKTNLSFDSKTRSAIKKANDERKAA